MIDYFKWSKYGSKEMANMSRKGENIRKRKDGRWEGRYLIYSEAKQKKISRSVYGKTYTEAKEKLLKAKVEVLIPAKEPFTPSIKMSVADTSQNSTGYMRFDTVAAEWLDDIRINKKHSTYIKYKTIYQKYLFESLSDYYIGDITDDIIRELLIRTKDEQILSESIEKSIYCVVNQIFNYTEASYHIKVDKARRRKNSKPSKPIKILSEKEQLDLLNVLYEDMDIYKLGVLICIFTGLRLGEICSLKWSDIDFQTRVLHVNRTVQRISIVEETAIKTTLLEDDPKSLYSNRYIPLPDALYELICRYKTDSVYFFNCDKPMEPRTYQKKFHKYLKNAGISDKNFHTLRHTFATNLVTSGADVKSLSEILGHSNVQITLNRYVHPSMDNKRSQLDSLFSIKGQNMGQIE